MAAGDEKIDVFDQVRILNRLSDAPVEIVFNGISYKWGPREVRSIVREYANKHFIHKSTFHWDPTEQNFPSQTLVIVDEQGRPTVKGASAEPLTLAQASPLDLLDESNLPPDRYTSVDNEGNVVPAPRKEYRSTGITPTSAAGGPRRINQTHPEMRVETSEALRDIPDPSAS